MPVDRWRRPGLAAKTTKFSARSHSSQAVGCKTPYLLGPNNRTKMFHVKHLGPIVGAHFAGPIPGQAHVVTRATSRTDSCSQTRRWWDVPKVWLNRTIAISPFVLAGVNFMQGFSEPFACEESLNTHSMIKLSRIGWHAFPDDCEQISGPDI